MLTNSTNDYSARSSFSSGSLLNSFEPAGTRMRVQLWNSCLLKELFLKNLRLFQKGDLDQSVRRGKMTTRRRTFLSTFSKILKLPDNIFRSCLTSIQRRRKLCCLRGVSKPETYIKNAGPLKIEPKVWLANGENIQQMVACHHFAFYLDFHYLLFPPAEQTQKNWLLSWHTSTLL